MSGLGDDCPVPDTVAGRVTMAHGGGGRVMRDLIRQMLVPAFDNPWLALLHDGAVLDVPEGRLAFTTDSYVVRPRFFPGGDIGSLAVHGTVNDLAMCGATPLALSCGLILEEGLELEELRRIVASMRAAAAVARVSIVTGDTKVVDRGRGDGVFINTAGIGVIPAGREVSPRRVRPGDAVLVSGDIGRHGVAVLAVREGLEFETKLVSDCAPLADLVAAMFAAGVDVHCLRDLTRGGLGAALIEIAESVGLRVEIDETVVPVVNAVRAACELLGLDPLQVACEGRMLAIVPPDQVGRALDAMWADPQGTGARQIGRVSSTPDGLVVATSSIGTTRVIDLPAGEQLPRIC